MVEENKQTYTEKQLEDIRRRGSEGNVSDLSRKERLAIAAPGSRYTRGGKIIHNWQFIKNEYVVGNAFTDPQTGIIYQNYPDIGDLAYKYGLNLQYLYLKSSNEGWGLQRDAFRAKFQDQLDNTNLNQFVTQSASYDAQTLHTIKKLFKLIGIYLTKFGEGIFEEEGEYQFTMDDLPEGISITLKELKDLTEILDRAHSLVRRVVGDSAANDTVKNLIEEIKKAKADKTKGKNADIGKIIDKELRARKEMEKQLEKLKGNIEE